MNMRLNILSRIGTLRERHRMLETEISTEERRPLPHTMTLQRLKRRRLAVKEEIESMEALMRGRQLLMAYSAA